MRSTPRLAALLLLAAPLSYPGGSLAAQNPTTARLWHAVALDFDGPSGLSETSTPNPFLDFRMDVTWSGPGGRRVVVPGYYAADGDAAESGASAGTRWRALFVPDFRGDWQWAVSFVRGPGVAVQGGGTPTAFDGARGSLRVIESDKLAPDFRARGLLRQDGHRYPRFAGTGEWFLEVGTGSPENVLAYADIDGTVDRGGEVPNFLHTFQPHRPDFAAFGGGPSWRGNLGEGLLGAINYLSSRRLNSMLVMAFTGYGDGDDVWPWLDRDDPLRFDCSKLDQWQRVLDHATRRGLHVQMLLGETENESYFEVREGGGTFADSRRLYYREMAARFAHTLGLSWNLCEEIGWTMSTPYSLGTTYAQRRAFASYLKAVDPYDHPVLLHTHWNNRTGVGQNGIYDPLTDPNNPAPEVNGASLQGPYDAHRSVLERSDNESANNHAMVVRWVRRSTAAGNPWLCGSHEQMPPFWGSVTDGHERDPTHDFTRKDLLWGNLLGGGSGVLHWAGPAFRPTSGDDVTLEDFRTRQDLWRQSVVAHDLFLEHLPFHRMEPMDQLVDDPLAYCLAEPGAIYAVYRRDATGPVQLDLQGSTAEFSVRWFDPLQGGALQRGSVATVTGPGPVTLGAPPRAALRGDWLILVEQTRRRPGTGCSTASLEFDGAAETGGRLRIRFADLPTHQLRGLLFGGPTTPFDLPTGLGCTSPCRVDLRPDVWLSDVADLSLQIPGDPALIGVSFRVQGFLSRPCLEATPAYDVELLAPR
ncbi:MAG: DUF5060 domain-containing protein [Planctomycetes bacterium]|nr:DUF5060 domain-containing protein [Planctomycetota bacterium]